MCRYYMYYGYLSKLRQYVASDTIIYRAYFVGSSCSIEERIYENTMRNYISEFILVNPDGKTIVANRLMDTECTLLPLGDNLFYDFKLGPLTVNYGAIEGDFVLHTPLELLKSIRRWYDNDCTAIV